MPRRRKHRKIVAPPGFRGYRPYGNMRNNSGYIELLYEEYEALKLADYDHMHHQEASRLMGISRPTFARIYESARRKIATALVETREIKTVFGNATLDQNWYTCQKCNARFSIPANKTRMQCAMCGSENIQNLTKEKI